jgi:hypothetical protein
VKLPAAALVAIAMLATGCSGEGPGIPPPGTAGVAQAPFPPAIRPYEPNINPDNFVKYINNHYLPLEPGTTYVYKGGTADESETVTVTVLKRTKRIMGVRCRVVKDVAEVNGQVVEKTFDWFAQDTDGNVWYFGETTKEYERKNGKVVTSSAGSWEAGIDGALPGILMLGALEVGVQYRQEYYKGEAEDMGMVVQIDGATRVAVGSFKNVVVTEDWTPLERNSRENKYYAPGVGLVREEGLKGDRAVLELVAIRS